MLAAAAFAAAALVFLLWQLLLHHRSRHLERRLERFARSMGHMDDWADHVEERLAAIEARLTQATRGPDADPPSRPFLEGKTARPATPLTAEEALQIIRKLRDGRAGRT